jgi:hypothetical protein
LEGKLNARTALLIAGAVVLDVFVNIGILCVTYPIWREFAYQEHPLDFWVKIYSWTGVLSTLVLAMVTGAVFSMYRHKTRKNTVTMQMIGTFVCLSSIAVAADFSEPYPASRWPDLIQEIAAKFFSELQSPWFILSSATCMTLVAGLLTLAALAVRDTLGKADSLR